MWTVAYVGAHRELKFREWLRENHIQAFVVVGKKLIKPRRKRKPVLGEAPLFLHYVFVNLGIDEDWHIVRKAPGFYYFVSFAGSIVMVHPNSIADLMDMQERGLFDEVETGGELNLLEGSFVEIINGPLEGRRGVVLKQPRDGFEKVMLDVQGIRVKIKLSLLGKFG